MGNARHGCLIASIVPPLEAAITLRFIEFVKSLALRYTMENLKKGIYRTTYGNAAYVSGPKAKTAWDLDMAERIPMSEVLPIFIRKAESGDTPSAYKYGV